jgi:hypothetical protein
MILLDRVGVAWWSMDSVPMQQDQVCELVKLVIGECLEIGDQRVVSLNQRRINEMDFRYKNEIAFGESSIEQVMFDIRKRFGYE